MDGAEEDVEGAGGDEVEGGGGEGEGGEIGGVNDGVVGGTGEGSGEGRDGVEWDGDDGAVPELEGDGPAPVARRGAAVVEDASVGRGAQVCYGGTGD